MQRLGIAFQVDRGRRPSPSSGPSFTLHPRHRLRPSAARDAITRRARRPAQAAGAMDQSYCSRPDLHVGGNLHSRRQHLLTTTQLSHRLPTAPPFAPVQRRRSQDVGQASSRPFGLRSVTLPYFPRSRRGRAEERASKSREMKIEYSIFPSKPWNIKTYYCRLA
jgi:hypothetical protein